MSGRSPTWARDSLVALDEVDAHLAGMLVEEPTGRPGPSMPGAARGYGSALLADAAARKVVALDYDLPTLAHAGRNDQAVLLVRQKSSRPCRSRPVPWTRW